MFTEYQFRPYLKTGAFRVDLRDLGLTLCAVSRRNQAPFLSHRTALAAALLAREALAARKPMDGTRFAPAVDPKDAAAW
jgi:hypothetical protein